MEFYIAISALTIVMLIVAIVRVLDLSRRMDSFAERMNKITENVKKNVQTTFLVPTANSLKSYGLKFSS